ncbi:MAG: sigma 54-interacting transcriptional regulator [Syntrophomonadaceae bacterium]|nr:sigma 54-interacting transcriptional regulator [Syntrophomonadaceae bacterium]
MKLKEIMTRNPILLRPEQTIKEAAAIFMRNQIDGAPVIDENNKLIGIFTKTHIYRAITREMDMMSSIEKLMTREVLTGHPDDKFENIVTPEVPRLPVTDENGAVVGILTRGDIARVFFDSYKSISSKLDAIINSTACNIIISIDEQGIIKVFNRTAEKLLDMRAEEVIGKSIRDVLPESGLMDVVRTGSQQPLRKIRIKNRCFLSNRSPIIQDGKIMGAVAVLQDISEIDKISKELKYVKELNRELDAIIESSYDGLCITDGEGIILRVNKAFEMITGINAHELLGKDVKFVEKEGLMSQSVLSLVLEKRESVTVMQEMRAGKTSLVTANPVFDRQGSVIRVVVNVRDITELNMLKQKLEQVQGLSQHYANQLRNLHFRYKGANNLVVNSSKMRNLLETVIRLAEVNSTILITGESGTGKELIAETIHNNSARKNGPFVKVNCGAIPESLLESELFGYESGAFTGARKEGKLGYCELASGGTIFLDEISELPLSLQAKLLRFLQNKEIIRIGGRNPFKVDVRIIAATNRNLLEMVRKREFREDVYYRLNVVPINIPPLRERKEDIPNLVVHFMQLFNNKYRLAKRIDPGVIDILMRHDWPGNIRELENLIERLVVTTANNIITADDLPSYLSNMVSDNSSEVLVSSIIPMRKAVESVEKQLLKMAYAQYNTTRQMARELEVAASTIVRKAAKYGIS